jgi:CelD/BcsL family acetyltransferase involved in cellulose biosynthesis
LAKSGPNALDRIAFIILVKWAEELFDNHRIGIFMKLQVYRNLQDLELLAKSWNQLVEESASHVPFLRYEYLTSWWQTLGGGEWENGDLFVVVARTEDGDINGIAPLFFTKNLDGKPALMFLGSIEISDYLDVIVRPDDLPNFVDALLEFLTESGVPAWEVLDLYNLLEDSPTLEVLKDSAARLGLTHTQEQLQPAPRVALPEDWDTYLAGIQKKQRHEIRRKIRRAEGAPEGIRWYIVEDETTLEDEIEAFLELMAYDHHKEKFLTDVMRTQMKAAIHTAFQAGWLQLAFLEVGGEKAAAYLNFDYANQLWVYNSGLNFEMGYYSPGWVLLGYLIQWAIDNGRTALDFMRGDENYKYRFGGIDRFIQRVQIGR